MKELHKAEATRSSCLGIDAHDDSLDGPHASECLEDHLLRGGEVEVANVDGGARLKSLHLVLDAGVVLAVPVHLLGIAGMVEYLRHERA